ncbi:MAG TPA: hypothetical protein VFV49_17560, partial [Thermoanaerobaculia bacterium]|nr:hypothetical protein [Thermoanaerobaculia bacterium]
DAAAKERYDSYKQAARQAIRFAGTEFILHEEGFHEQTPDVDWKIEPVHDGAILLHVTMNRVEKVEQQHIPVSFTDPQEDLPRRIETIIHTRLNRIRYIWPYSTSEPLILRDVSFSLDQKKPLRAQYITWTHPEKSMFVRGGKDYELKLAEGESDSYKFVLGGWPPETASEKRPDPMSNAAYRVILERPTVARPLFRNLTLALVLLLAAAALAVIYDWIRARRAQAPQLSLVAKPDLRAVE